MTRPHQIIDDPSHPAMRGRYEPGTISAINYFREERGPWESVEVILTRRCPLHCAHCIAEASPSRTETMTESLLDALLASLAVFGRTRYVCLMGGEPAAVPRLLQRGLRQCRSLGLIPSSVTSGAWAATPDQAAAGARMFASAEHLLVSTDRFHQVMVPLSTVIRALEACRRAGIHASVCYTATPGEFAGTEPIDAELLDACRRLGAGIVMPPLTDTGRASGHDDWVPELPADRPCAKLDVPLFDSSGEAYACGPGWSLLHGKPSPFRLGRFPDQSLAELFAARYDSALFCRVAREGPAAALQACDGPPVTGSALRSPCTACREVMRRVAV